MQREYQVEQSNIIHALRLLAMFNPGVWTWKDTASSEIEYALSEQGMADALDLTDSIVRHYSDDMQLCTTKVVSTAGAAITMYKDKEGKLNVSLNIQPEILMHNTSDEITQAIYNIRERDQEYLLKTVDV